MDKSIFIYYYFAGTTHKYKCCTYNFFLAHLLAFYFHKRFSCLVEIVIDDWAVERIYSPL